MRVAHFDAQCALLVWKKLDDASQIQHKSQRAAIRVDWCPLKWGRDSCQGLRVTLETGARFPEKAKVIPADAALQAEETLKNFSAIMRSGTICAARKVQNIAIRIENGVEAVGKVPSHTRIGATPKSRSSKPRRCGKRSMGWERL